MISTTKKFFLLACLVQSIALANYVPELWSAKDCNLDRVNCSVKNFSQNSLKLTTENGNVILLSPQAHLLAEEKNKFVLLKGSVLIDAAADFALRTEHGVVSGQKGIVELLRSKNHSTAKAFEGEHTIVLKGKNEKLTLPIGFKYKYFGINAQGYTQAMFPEVLKIKQDYIPLFDFGHKHLRSLESRLLSGVDGLDEAVEAETAMKIQVVERQVAEHQAEELRKKRLAAQRQKEKEDLIRFIKQKNYLD